MNLSGRLSVALDVPTHDWTPPGVSQADIIAVRCTGSVDLTGITRQQRGRLIVVQVTEGTLVFQPEDSASVEANRFGTVDVVTLTAGNSILIYYDQALSRWMLISGGSK